MFEFLKKVINSPNGSVNKIDEKIFKLQVSVCIILVDIAKIDGDFTGEEKKIITSILKNDFNVEETNINEMILKAEDFLKKEDSIYDFTQVINQNLDNDDKYELLKSLWRLVYVDHNKDIYEEHLVKKIAGLLDLDNRDVIAARLTIKDELKIDL